MIKVVGEIRSDMILVAEDEVSPEPAGGAEECYSPVFSAFWLGVMDVTHKYAWSREILLAAADDEEKAALVNDSLSRLKSAAYRDMRGEGFRPEGIRFYLEVFCRAAGDALEERVLFLADTLTAGDLGELRQKFTVLSSVMLNAVVAVPHQEIPCFEIESSDPSRAKTGERQIFWPGEKRMLLTGIHRRERLRPGNVIAGPAVVESVDTTCVVPVGYRFTVDSYLNGVIEEWTRSCVLGLPNTLRSTWSGWCGFASAAAGN